MTRVRLASFVLAFSALGVSSATAQAVLIELLQRHGVETRSGIEAAFDAHDAPAVPVTPGSFATPLAALTTTAGSERNNAAYAFAILAGRSGRAASPQELAAAGQVLILMITSDDRRARIAGARVAGRIFASPYDRSGVRSPVPQGMVDGLFALLNRDHEVDQLVAMDALGLLREPSAVGAITERYHFYRDGNKRALAGGALEALARIGHASAADIVRQVAGDKWAEGNDATALAVAFARERLLKDGSIAVIRKALDEKSHRNQARGYLAELGAAAP